MKGFVMKQSKGKANPRLVDEILRRKMAGSSLSGFAPPCC
jgi:Asp-tRNA(Asn)/Glu-tRNA(Gln) amidotransferase B subunit